MTLWQHNMWWKIYSVACNDVSFAYNMATMDLPSAILLYSAYSGCGYDENSKESQLLLPDQGLQKGAWKLLFAIKKT